MLFAFGHRYVKNSLKRSCNYFQTCKIHSREIITPVKRYSQMLESGILKADKNQFFAVLKLQEIYNELKDRCTIIENPKDKVTGLLFL